MIILDVDEVEIVVMLWEFQVSVSGPCCCKQVIMLCNKEEHT